MRAIAIFLTLSITLSTLFAQTLNDLIKEALKHHPDLQQIEIQKRALKARAQSAITTDPAELQLGGGYALDNDSSGGKEFFAGISKEFFTPAVKRALQESSELLFKSELLRLESRLLESIYTIEYLYFDSCLQKKKLLLKEKLYEEFNRFARKMRRAQELGEISKKDLITIESELAKDELELKLQKSSYRASLISLQRELYRPKPIGELSCSEDFETFKIELNEKSAVKRSLNIKSKELKIKALKRALKKFDALFDRYTLSAEYSDEFGTTRYGGYISLPLYSLSKKKELEKKILMEQISLETLNMHAQKLKTENMIKELKEILHTIHDSIALYKELEKEKSRLVQMVQRSYLSGESSVTELISAKKERVYIYLKTIDLQQEYLKRLFDMYKTASIKEIR